MKKIPTIFVRDFEGNPANVLNKQNPECAWVFNGEGVATRKYDGTSCMFDGESWWKRREVREGKQTPPNFVEQTHDAKTGKRTGWIPVDPNDKWHLEGIDGAKNAAAGTYELCGPKVQGNPEGFSTHRMISHANAETFDVHRSFDALREWLLNHEYEGIVFHHPDGRMAKIKRRDFQ